MLQRIKVTNTVQQCVVNRICSAAPADATPQSETTIYHVVINLRYVSALSRHTSKACCVLHSLRYLRFTFARVKSASYYPRAMSSRTGWYVSSWNVLLLVIQLSQVRKDCLYCLYGKIGGERVDRDTTLNLTRNQEL